VSDDRSEYKERSDDRPEDVEGHKMKDQADVKEEPDVEGHSLNKEEHKEYKEYKE
jgi:hypothetical protein